MGEIKRRRELKDILEEERKKGKKIVFTNGCFDILHPGHIHLLVESKKRGNILVVGINSDDSVRRLKGEGRPIFPENERAEILASLEMVDYVTVFGEDDPYHLINQLKPNVLVKGGDWRKEEVIGKDLIESWGGEVVIAPYLSARTQAGKEGYSTSRILDRIKKGE